MRRPFASELNNVFTSGRFSEFIRPLTIKITSPFAALVILSIFPLFGELNFQRLGNFAQYQFELLRKVRIGDRI